MSVEARNPDPSILRKFELSKKEETLKNKLFKKKDNPGQSLSRTNVSGRRHESPKSATLKSSSTMKENNLNLTNSISDKAMEGFWNNMADAIKEENKKQVTVGMLNTQQQILRQHTDILNENQRSIAKFMTEGVPGRKEEAYKNSKMAEDHQKQMMREIIGPINAEIAQIKKMYEGTKKLAEEAAGSVSNYRTMVERGETAKMSGNPNTLQSFEKMQESFGNYKHMNSDLKDMVLNAQGNLSNVLPENMHIIKQISDLNVQAYTDCINTLKKQVEDLQRDAERAEKELESRYKKLSAVPKAGSIKSTDPYYSLVVNGPETSEEVIKNIRTIDFQNSRTIIMNKLGGEFDYEQFNHDISEMAKDIYTIREKTLEDLEQYQIDIPSQLELLEYDKSLADAVTKSHSILDELKAKYNVPKQMAYPKASATISPSITTPFYPSTGFQQGGDDKSSTGGPLKAKKKSQRPKEFDYIKTRPETVLPDIEFVKMENPAERAQQRIEFEYEVEPPRRPQQQSSSYKVPVSPPRHVQLEEEEDNIQRQEEYQPKRSSNQKVAFQEEARQQEETRGRGNEPPVQINMDRYNVKMSSGQEVRPKDSHEMSFDQVKGSDALLNRMFEGMLLQDIKEQILYSNVKPTQQDEPQYIPHTQVETQAQTQSFQAPLSTSAYAQNQLFYPQLPQPASFGGDQIDDKLIQQLTLEALSQKLLADLRSEEAQAQEKPKAAGIFEPVQTKTVPDVNATVAQAQAGQQANQMANMFGLNNAQLPTLIAENIMNLFNAAMMQMNTSLNRNLPQVSQVEDFNQRNKTNVNRILETVQQRKEQPQTQTQAQTQPIVTRENIREDLSLPQNEANVPSSKPNLFAKMKKEIPREEPSPSQNFNLINESDLRDPFISRQPAPTQYRPEDRRAGFAKDSLLDSLYHEGRSVQEEQELLRQKKHFVSPGQALPGNYGLPMQQSYYFTSHEPQPIANLSEYYRELQSDFSGSELNNTRPASMRNFQDFSHRDNRSVGPRTPSVADGDLLSEGQIFPNMDSRRNADSEMFNETSYGASRRFEEGEISVDPRTSSKRPALTENLFKSLHEDEKEPGEISIFNIFKP